jgi:hypothetical protein
VQSYWKSTALPNTAAATRSTGLSLRTPTNGPLLASLGASLAVWALGCAPSRLPRVPAIDPSEQVAGGNLALGEARLLPAVCTGTPLTPETGTLDETAFVGFLKSKGLPTRIEKARTDLFYVEAQVNPETDQWVRLRVAILNTPEQAGRELHEAVLQHGMGAWGVHRGNLAVLGPAGSVDDIVRFAAKTKISCWGVLTVAGADDAFVIPGNYREL